MPLQLPLFQSSPQWRPPATFPTLGPKISLDLETRDPGLKTRGAGYKFKDGEIIGYALADESTQVYLPVAHRGGGNLPRKPVEDYLRRVLSEAKQVIMANATYDLGWLLASGFQVPGTVMDVQVAAALLDEELPSYSLDRLSFLYLGQRKDESILREASESFELANPKSFDPKGDMFQLHAGHVGAYAEQDARITFDLMIHLEPMLQAEDLNRVFDLECRVTKALVAMTIAGTPVDLEASAKLRDTLKIRETQLNRQFAGTDIWSSPQVAELLKAQGVPVLYTEKGNPSVPKAYLESLEHPVAKALLEARATNRLRKVYIEDTILNSPTPGRIHTEFRQTASDEGGTRSGRLSSQNPNLQQVPKRSDIGKMIRKLYVAEPGSLWAKIDYSSQEPRLQVHYALILDLPGAKEAAEVFRQGRKLYHFFEEATGLPYDTCKMLCLGISYGMGQDKMAQNIGVTVQECSSILDRFHQKAPFLSLLFDRTMTQATRKGYIRTILGRRSHFDYWSPSRDQTPVKGLETAKKRWPDSAWRLQRSFVSKALNRLIQGSAADQTKLALVEAFEQGFDVRLPVHDEINAMVASEKEALQMKELMENVITLNLPVVADLDLGLTWC